MYLVDTQVLIWWLVNPDRLGQPHAALLDSIEEGGGRIGLSPASFFETAYLDARGRITIPQPAGPWLERIENDPRVLVYPLTARVSADAARLPEPFPKDPFDRIIAATARVNGLILITADTAIRNSGIVPVV